MSSCAEWSRLSSWAEWSRLSSWAECSRLSSWAEYCRSQKPYNIHTDIVYILVMMKLTTIQTYTHIAIWYEYYHNLLAQYNLCYQQLLKKIFFIISLICLKKNINAKIWREKNKLNILYFFRFFSMNIYFLRSKQLIFII